MSQVEPTVLRDLAATLEVEVVILTRGSLPDLFAFCDGAPCRTVALLRVAVISSVGRHTDPTLIDDVAAVSRSTPTHAGKLPYQSTARPRTQGTRLGSLAVEPIARSQQTTDPGIPPPRSLAQRER
jgi:exodeoxyribonuclease VII large subunit